MAENKQDYIKLDQFLKLSGIAATGGQAKLMITQLSEVYVNGERETRRGRKLYPGDIVTVDGRKLVVG
ncbi:MAG: RNA-binding S4 domain-containing protein [Solobacterium sp.]|nr:RNA-binding S4 domain-containing protein [Solobacterium sp.]